MDVSRYDAPYCLNSAFADWVRVMPSARGALPINVRSAAISRPFV